MKFSKSLKKQRNKLGLTQQEVAKKLFVTRQTISNWENGKSYPDLDMLIKISDVYQISIDSLLKGDQDLKKSLDKDKVKSILSPLNYVPSLLIVLSLLVTDVLQDPWSTWIAGGISVISMIIIFVQFRMSHYTSDMESKNKTIIILSISIVLAFVIMYIVVFYLFAHQNIRRTLSILIIIAVTLTIILSIITGFLSRKYKCDE